MTEMTPDEARTMAREAGEYADRIVAQDKRMAGEEAAAHWKAIAEQERDALKAACYALHMAGYRVNGAGLEFNPFKSQSVSALAEHFEEVC